MTFSNNIHSDITSISQEVDNQIKNVFDTIEKSLKRLLTLKNEVTSNNFNINQEQNTHNVPIMNQSTSTAKSGLFSSSTNNQKLHTSNTSSSTQGTQNQRVFNQTRPKSREIRNISEQVKSVNDYGISLDYLMGMGSRLLGEIAFQLDRRIVMHVFDDNLNEVSFFLALFEFDFFYISMRDLSLKGFLKKI